MGYYTRFNLEVDDPKGTFVRYMDYLQHRHSPYRLLKDVAGEGGVDAWMKEMEAIEDRLPTMKFSSSEHIDFIADIYRGNCPDEVKWYENEQDMRHLSAAFPEVTFILKGEGESSGDIWVKYFRDGKCQIAKGRIVIDEFDAKKLR